MDHNCQTREQSPITHHDQKTRTPRDFSITQLFLMCVCNVGAQMCVYSVGTKLSNLINS